jgi:hypothetical protein
MADYEAIEAAVMETERGRWFLREYARRNRNADTEMLLDAIARLEQTIRVEKPATDRDQLRATLSEMAQAIGLTRAEAGELRKLEHVPLGEPDPEPLLSVVRVSREAASAGRRAVMEIREAATALRSNVHDPRLLDDIKRSSAAVVTALDHGEAGARTVERIVSTLRYLEARIQEMLSPGMRQGSADTSPALGVTTDPEGVPTESDGKELPSEVPKEDRDKAQFMRQEEMTAETGDAGGDIETRELAQLRGLQPSDRVEDGELHDPVEIAACEKAAAGSPTEGVTTRAHELVHACASPPPRPENSEPVRAELRSTLVPPSGRLPERVHEFGVPSPTAAPSSRAPTTSLRREAFAEIDRLSTREKLRLFS